MPNHAIPAPGPDCCRQHRLAGDPPGGLSRVSVAAGPGQRMAVHDHGGRGVVGVRRGAGVGIDDAGAADGRRVPGAVIARSPGIGDIRAVFDPASGAEKPFVAGGSTPRLPNPWLSA
jgi:hypothetical protein